MTKSRIEVLNELIDICEDARKFYTDAAEQTESSRLQTTFQNIATAREGIIVNLKSHIIAIGGKIESDGTFIGQTSNLFGQLKAKVGDTDITLVTELEDTEDKTLEAFRAAMDEDPPEATLNLLERQTQLLNDSHIYMRNLKHTLQNFA
jgi:uncharacterized protein (TIGR02284 family)